jgi:hypothetical protein
MGLQIRADVSATETEYGAVLLDERSGRYWQLNPTGAVVLRTLLAGGTPAEAVAALTDEFDVDQAQAGDDVGALVAQLRSAGLAT